MSSKRSERDQSLLHDSIRQAGNEFGGVDEHIIDNIAEKIYICTDCDYNLPFFTEEGDSNLYAMRNHVHNIHNTRGA